MKRIILVILVLIICAGLVGCIRNKPQTHSNDYYDGYADGYKDGKNESSDSAYESGAEEYIWKLAEVDEKLNKIEGMIEEFDDAGYDLDDIYAAIIEVRDYINKK